MRITIDIEEAPGAKATISSGESETMRISAGSVRTDLLARRNTGRGVDRDVQQDTNQARHHGSPSDVRLALNPLRAGAAIERRLVEEARDSAINAGPPSHKFRGSLQPELDKGQDTDDRGHPGHRR
jgi:hypothetical protein